MILDTCDVAQPRPVAASFDARWSLQCCPHQHRRCCKIGLSGSLSAGGGRRMLRTALTLASPLPVSILALKPRLQHFCLHRRARHFPQPQRELAAPRVDASGAAAAAVPDRALPLLLLQDDQLINNKVLQRQRPLGALRAHEPCLLAARLGARRQHGLQQHVPELHSCLVALAGPEQPPRCL